MKAKLALGELARSLNPRLRVIFALGGPGTGKGTVCAALASKYAHCGWRTLSAGALLREEAASGDDNLARYLAAGRVVPPERSATAVLRALHRLPTPSAGENVAIVDGFPRDVGAARLWDAYRPGACAFVLHVPDELLQTRLLARGRGDDVPETVARRLEYHGIHTRKLIEHFGDRGVVLDGTGEPYLVVQRVEEAMRTHPFNLL